MTSRENMRTFQVILTRSQFGALKESPYGQRGRSCDIAADILNGSMESLVVEAEGGETIETGLLFRVEDKARLKELAASENMSISDLVRNRLFGSTPAVFSKESVGLSFHLTHAQHKRLKAITPTNQYPYWVTDILDGSFTPLHIVGGEPERAAFMTARIDAADKVALSNLALAEGVPLSRFLRERLFDDPATSAEAVWKLKRTRISLGLTPSQKQAIKAMICGYKWFDEVARTIIDGTYQPVEIGAERGTLSDSISLSIQNGQKESLVELATTHGMTLPKFLRSRLFNSPTVATAPTSTAALASEPDILTPADTMIVLRLTGAEYDALFSSPYSEWDSAGTITTDFLMDTLQSIPLQSGSSRGARRFVIPVSATNKRALDTVASEHGVSTGVLIKNRLFNSANRD